MKLWFYVKTPSLICNLDDGMEITVYPYASGMKEMKPLYKMDPLAVASDECKACDLAFALACRYSGGCDLVEEMVASDFWPLGRRNEGFTIEMEQVPVYGPLEGLPFPRFGRSLEEGKPRSLSSIRYSLIPGG